MIATQPSKPVVRPRGKPPRPWWDYEEELARQKQQARHELAELRQQHTQDLGILLSEQVKMREQMMELAGTRDDEAGGASATGGLAAALASTASEAQALHLSLLEKQNGSLKAEAQAARADAAEARRALEQHGEQERGELARLRAEVMAAAGQLKTRPTAAQRSEPAAPTPEARSRPQAAPSSNELHLRDEQARLRRQLEATQAELAAARKALKRARSAQRASGAGGEHVSGGAGGGGRTGDGGGGGGGADGGGGSGGAECGAAAAAALQATAWGKEAELDAARAECARLQAAEEKLGETLATLQAERLKEREAARRHLASAEAGRAAAAAQARLGVGVGLGLGLGVGVG